MNMRDSTKLLLMAGVVVLPIGLKLLGLVEWPWFWVSAPLGLCVLILALLIFAVLVAASLSTWDDFNA